MPLGPSGSPGFESQSPRAESPFLREGPDSFTQTTILHEDGSREFIATGLAANLFGEQLKDVGRVVWLPVTNEIVFSAGPHTVREALEFGTFQDALEAFCDVLS